MTEYQLQQSVCPVCGEVTHSEPVVEARAYVQAKPAAHLDETGCREGQQRTWPWTAVTFWVAVSVVRLSRSGKVAQELMVEHFWGWLVTDRWT